MKLRFIGEDGSMGLKHGKIYEVDITIPKYGYIIVEWYNPYLTRCPYKSLSALCANWIDV